MRKASIIPVFLILSACGGGGGSLAPFVPGPQAFTDIVNEHRALEQAAGGASVTGSGVTLPTTPATYEGFIVFDTNPGGLGQLHYSRITLETDFATLSTSGGGDDFWYYDEVAGGANGVQVAGNIDVSSGAVTVGSDFAVQVSGTLDIAGGGLETVDTSGSNSQLSATFGGATSPQYFTAGKNGETTDFVGGPSIQTRIIGELQ